MSDISKLEQEIKHLGRALKPSLEMCIMVSTQRQVVNGLYHALVGLEIDDEVVDL